MTSTKYWAAVWTPRGHTVRIISVRRARKEEISDYEGN
ncbi:MAG TPA: BrnT family toxin [Gemmatimonadetes bacterium]|nr:BrnT family toxin [Gemmatimonadota bacterium]